MIYHESNIIIWKCRALIVCITESTTTATTFTAPTTNTVSTVTASSSSFTTGTLVTAGGINDFLWQNRCCIKQLLKRTECLQRKAGQGKGTRQCTLKAAQRSTVCCPWLLSLQLAIRTIPWLETILRPLFYALTAYSAPFLASAASNNAIPPLTLTLTHFSFLSPPWLFGLSNTSRGPLIPRFFLFR